MIAVRILIFAVALAAGILMIKYPTVESNLRINAAVALINPTLFSFVNILGLTALAGEAPVHRVLFILTGSVLIVLGTSRTGRVPPVEKGGGGQIHKANEGIKENTATRLMTVARFGIVTVSLAACILMFIFPTVEANLRINAVVAMINPFLLAIINLVGIRGIAGRVPVRKLLLVTAGAILIIAGTVK